MPMTTSDGSRTAADQQHTQIFSGSRQSTSGTPLPIERLDPGAYLIVDSDEDTVVHQLDAGVTRIGRALAADLRLDDHTVSARHAIVTVQGDGIRLLDDRSTNGTFVNGKRVDSVELSSGDAVMLGRVTLSFLEVSA